MDTLWYRLPERELVQWALAYLAGAWVLLQVLDVRLRLATGAEAQGGGRAP